MDMRAAEALRHRPRSRSTASSRCSTSSTTRTTAAFVAEREQRAATASRRENLNVAYQPRHAAARIPGRLLACVSQHEVARDHASGTGRGRPLRRIVPMSLVDTRQGLPSLATRRARRLAQPALSRSAAVPDRGSHDRRRPSRPSSRGASPAAAWCRPISIARRPTTASPTRCVTKDGARHPEPRRHSAGRRAADVSDQDGRQSSTLLPDFDQYAGPPIEFGRMEADCVRSGRAAAVRDDRRAFPTPARSTRSARSTSAASGRSPARATSTGTRRPGRCRPARPRSARSSASCRMRSSGRPSSTPSTAATPDLAAMPMYCVPFSFKDPFDTKDMRSTGGGDARYDIDFPARDHTLVAQLRQQGRHHLRQGEHDRIQRRAAGDPGGTHLPDKVLRVDARLPAQHVGRQPVQRLRHDARSRRSDRARDRACRSAPTSRCAASARRRARRAAVRPITTRSRCSCRTRR